MVKEGESSQNKEKAVRISDQIVGEWCGENIIQIGEGINLFLNQVNGEKILSLVYTPSIADYMYL